MEKKINIFWLRRDLRLEDNTGLHFALQEKWPVLLLFIFDTTILQELADKADRRVLFIYRQLEKIQQQVQAAGSSLLVVQGEPLPVFKELLKTYPLQAVFTNRDYEPYARERDARIEKLLREKGVAFSTYKDQVIFEMNEVVKDDGKPYTVFTPYYRKWRSRLDDSALRSFKKEQLAKLYQANFPFPSLKEIGFEEGDVSFPSSKVDTGLLRHYDRQRDFPSLKGTSQLGVHLRFGTISIRQLVSEAAALNETYVKELVWREFFQMILWHFPQVVAQSFKPAYDNIQWRNNETEFAAWCNGMTGYPIVDAGMRELNATGYMHNRVRMITASFLVKHLLIDWRWGEAYFAEKLLDYDLAANNGGWQWAAGSGCDAAPYFRIFNPELQTKKFDPERKYIKQWVPEFATAGYPSPIVEHEFARKRCMEVYGQALKK